MAPPGIHRRVSNARAALFLASDFPFADNVMPFPARCSRIASPDSRGANVDREREAVRVSSKTLVDRSTHRTTLMRCYCHLTNGNEIIRDERGIEVRDHHDLRVALIRTIAELRADHPQLAAEGVGWTLCAADAAGGVLFTMPLGHCAN